MISNTNTDSLESTTFANNELAEGEISIDESLNVVHLDTEVMKAVSPHHTAEMQHDLDISGHSNAVPLQSMSNISTEMCGTTSHSNSDECIIISHITSAGNRHTISCSDTETSDDDDSKSDSTCSSTDHSAMFSPNSRGSHALTLATTETCAYMTIMDSCMDIDVHSVVRQFISGNEQLNGNGSAVTVSQFQNEVSKFCPVFKTVECSAVELNQPFGAHDDSSVDSTSLDFKLKIVAMLENETANMPDWSSKLPADVYQSNGIHRKRKRKIAKQSHLDDEMAVSLSLLELANSAPASSPNSSVPTLGPTSTAEVNDHTDYMKTSATTTDMPITNDTDNDDEMIYASTPSSEGHEDSLHTPETHASDGED